MLCLYVFQTSFFVAWFTLDQRRIEANRDGLLPCVKHRDWKPWACSQLRFGQIIFRDYFSKFLLKTPVKIAVIFLTTVILALNIWGFINLRQEFDRTWFLPTSSYLYKFFDRTKEFFPGQGEKGSVFMGQLNYAMELENIDRLARGLRAQKESIQEVVVWTDDFLPWMQKHFNFSASRDRVSDVDFRSNLSLFLHSPKGLRYQSHFKFDGELSCRDPVPKILTFCERGIVLQVSRMDYQHFWMGGPEEHVPAMHQVKNVVRAANISSGDGMVRAWARAYLNWETDDVIQTELYRNLAFGLLCVFFMTLLLIANIHTSLMVFLCVLMTMVNMAGLMHWWGLTIDTVSSLSLILAIGLSVDYSAHVGHTFMTCQGTREERAEKTLATIGPAVFHGGFSTFLAFILLCRTDSHVFSTFFKIFFGVVIFGLYHGLCFLPVILSLVGPSPYGIAHKKHLTKTPPDQNGQTILSDKKQVRDKEPRKTDVFDGQRKDRCLWAQVSKLGKHKNRHGLPSNRKQGEAEENGDGGPNSLPLNSLAYPDVVVTIPSERCRGSRPASFSEKQPGAAPYIPPPDYTPPSRRNSSHRPSRQDSYWLNR
ncbi:unnamed protein product [Darwinula stevensoni]|uniref:SSD domain-containing protein n=1 Tax=Darwinula stevensoni TaxID=69355 RepID=A0A7R9A0V3_9CRUS|nr:unnamed protein product [Darwinula stevensoni]CAG0885312.1 unnamed protein product [Darwinula stevensoni]